MVLVKSLCEASGENIHFWEDFITAMNGFISAAYGLKCMEIFPRAFWNDNIFIMLEYFKFYFQTKIKITSSLGRTQVTIRELWEVRTSELLS